MKQLWAFVMLVAAGLLALPLQVSAEATGAAVGEAAGEVTVEVTPDMARGMARQALQVGNADLAVRIAAQLLAVNPDDVGAQLLLTAGLTRSGRLDEAAQAGRRGFALATTDAQRFEAAYLTAEALSAQDHPYLAKLWLRRADTYSPDKAATEVLRVAFQKLEARTPFKPSLSFGGGPTNNVNGGSLHDSFDFWGIPIPIAQALPGVALSSTATLSYRLVSHPDLAARLYMTGRQRNVWLSARALTLQPGAQNADYLYNSLDLGGTVDWVSAGATAFHLDLRTGQRWQGGARQSDQQRLVFGITRGLGQTHAAHLDLTAEATRIPATPRANSVRLAADMSLASALPGGNLRYDLGLTQVDAEAAGIAYRAVSAGINWQPDSTAKAISLGFFADAEVRHYWKTPDFEPDIQIEAGVTAQFPNLSAYGFSPSVTLSAVRSFSPVVVRDTSNIALSVGLVSSF